MKCKALLQEFLIQASLIKLKASCNRYRLIHCLTIRAIQVWMSPFRLWQSVSERTSAPISTSLAEIVNGLLKDKLPKEKLQEVQPNMSDQKIAPIWFLLK